MARLNEQELFCTVCEQTKAIPVCCGREMEWDSLVFFCPLCNKELKPVVCCGNDMVIRTKIRDIKKELFGEL